MHLLICVYPEADRGLFNIIGSPSRTLSLIADGSRLSVGPATQVWPPKRTSSLNKMSFSKFPLGQCRERTVPLASTKQAKCSGPILESLVINRFDMTHWLKHGWRSHDPSVGLNFHGLSRLTLVNCDNAYAMQWQRYPPDLAVLEILDPFQNFPVKCGLYLSDNILAQPLAHFRNLAVLNLQNIGPPIGEVLWNLCENSKKLKVLKLHDQDVEGIDICYRFRRNQPLQNSEFLECPLHKLLVHICPAVQILSVDISSSGLKQNVVKVYNRSFDWRSTAWSRYWRRWRRRPHVRSARPFACLVVYSLYD